MFLQFLTRALSPAQCVLMVGPVTALASLKWPVNVPVVGLEWDALVSSTSAHSWNAFSLTKALLYLVKPNEA